MNASRLRVEDAEASDEAALLEQARSGDGAALDRLIGRYLTDVYDVAYRILGDSDVAQDAAQDAFVNALNGLGKFRGEASFRTWLLRIAVNAARSVARRKVRRREIVIAPDDELVQQGPDPSAQVAFRSEAERMSGALAALPEKQRMAVTLRVYQGLSYHEIADLLGSSEGAARVNYHLGVKRLREILK